MDYHKKPNPALFDTHINQLRQLVILRMRTLRALSKFSDPYKQDPKVSEIINKADLSFALQDDLNNVSYWTCRFALHSEDDARWHMNAETQLWLYLYKFRKNQWSQ